MKNLLKSCQFNPVQKYTIAAGLAFGAAMGAAENDMGSWLGVGAAIGLGLALAHGARRQD
ncbi:MAG: hypothetical protein R3270_09480 [Gammaproteobacteria bacterium]|nr:hypothetical protein [Gammaproteobacteria bacterium]